MPTLFSYSARAQYSFFGLSISKPKPEPEPKPILDITILQVYSDAENYNNYSDFEPTQESHFKYCVAGNTLTIEKDTDIHVVKIAKLL